MTTPSGLSAPNRSVTTTPFLFHHYSIEGKELGAYIPFSQVSGVNGSATEYSPPGPLVGGGWEIRASGNRVGTELGSHGKQKWVEIDTGGNLLGQWEYDPASYSLAALTTSGSLYARLWIDHRPAGYVRLDRQASSWKKVKGLPRGTLIGSEYDDLVVAERVGAWTVMKRVLDTDVHLESVAQVSLVP